jgi:hypothetical protein
LRKLLIVEYEIFSNELVTFTLEPTLLKSYRGGLLRALLIPFIRGMSQIWLEEGRTFFLES